MKKSHLTIIIASIVLALTASCKSTNQIKTSPDSISYDLYRGIRLTDGSIEPVFIPSDKNVYQATDTVSVNINGFIATDDVNSHLVIISVNKGILKIATADCE